MKTDTSVPCAKNGADGGFGTVFAREILASSKQARFMRSSFVPGGYMLPDLRGNESTGIQNARGRFSPDTAFAAERPVPVRRF
jgi:hypothetical protein